MYTVVGCLFVIHSISVLIRSAKMEIQRREIVNLFILGKTEADVARFVADQLSIRSLNKANQCKVRFLWVEIKNRWNKCGRIRERFEKVNSVWLTGKEIFDIQMVNSAERSEKTRCPRKKPFSEITRKAKLKHVKELVKERTAEELGFATGFRIARDGSRNIGKRPFENSRKIRSSDTIQQRYTRIIESRGSCGLYIP